MSLFRAKILSPKSNPPASASDSTALSIKLEIEQQQAMAQAQMVAAIQARENQAREAALRRQRLPEEMVVAALSGWRRWSVEMFGEILLSNNLTKWEPRKRLVAECKRKERNAYMVAQANMGMIPMPYQEGDCCKGIECACGIYAYKLRFDAQSMENAPSMKTHVFGEVWLWGRIVEHQGGYRAQYAYPKAFVRTAISERLAVVYGARLID
jgi:hypothetical protein